MVGSAAKRRRVWSLGALVNGALALGLWLSMMVTGCGSPDVPSAPPPVSSAHAPGGLSPSAADAALELTDLPPDPREKRLGPLLAQLLPAQHLLHTPLDDALSRRAFTTFISQLDGDKLLLLQKHVDALKAYESDIDDQLVQGDLVLARKGAALLAHRQQVVANVIQRVMAQPFDFAKYESIETDPHKRSYCTTEAALAERWRLVLKLLVLDQLARFPPQSAELTPDFIAAEADARRNLAHTFAARLARRDEILALAPVERLLNAVANSYDAHTRYFPPSAQQALSSSTTGSEEGIGLALAESSGELVVNHIEAGGPASKESAIAVGDVVLTVAERGEEPVSLQTIPLARANALLRGPRGTTVVVTLRKSNGKTPQVEMTREVVSRDWAYARAAELKLASQAGASSWGYVWLPSFYDNRTASSGEPIRDATMDLRRHLNGFATRKRAGVVLDLRANRGGIVQHAVDIAGLLIKKGPMVQTLDAEGKLGKLIDIHPITNFDGAVVVLVDSMTASASEILAAALQDYRRAIIIGTTTYGKGTVQKTIDLDRHAFGAGPVAGQPLGALRLTTEQYFGVDGVSPQHAGVVPDVRLPDPVAHLRIGERYVSNTVPPRKIAALPFVPYSEAATAAAANTQQRIAGDSDLRRVVERNALLAQNQQNSTVGLERNAWLATRNRLSAGIAKTQPSGDLRLRVTVVDGGGASTTKPGGANEHLDTWIEDLSKDVWLEQAIALLVAMQ